ncbi:MAG: D-alanyl-D-alanine carboxypeptidase [Lachnospiraceae bacterium]|nr:D-alanyl-D-alanine carboxypeptidase [Lachnospiraceae bacterium]
MHKMGRRLRQILTRLWIVLLIGGTVLLPARALEPVSLKDAVALPEAPPIQSDYAILMEMKSGAILYEKNARQKAFPASITKIMTGLLTIENCALSENVTFSYRATHEIPAGSSHIARTEGEIMTVEECLYGMLVASANEVAQGLAEHISGSLESFASLMTLRAYELGAVNTNFTNAHGFYEAEHYTCAYDMALIMQEALKHETLKSIMGTEKYQIPPTNKHNEITYLQMKHPLLSNVQDMKYPYALAGKTGYTDESLNTLVTYARQGDLDLICVVMHAPGSKATGEDSVALFNYGFQNFRCLSLSSAESILQNRQDNILSGDLLHLTYSSDAWCTLPAEMSLADLRSEIILLGGSEENALAVRIYYIGEQEVGRCLLSASPRESIIQMTPVVRVEPSRNEILRQVHLGLPLIYWILIGGGVVLLLIFLFLFLFVRRYLRRQKRRREQDKRALNRIAE